MTSETCSISSRDVERFRCYGVPDDAKVEKPSWNQTIFDRPKGMVAVYMDFFDYCGLRFPLTTFFQECLLYYGVSITQLTPNSVKCVVGFEVLCRLANVKPSMALFAYFFLPTKTLPHWYSIRPRSKLYPKLILNLPVSFNWKSKFVFVGEEMFPEKMVWKRANDDNQYPNPWLTGKVLDEGKVLEEVRVLSVFGVGWSILLSEKMLHLAKMPNAYSGPLPVKFCDTNGNEISAVDFLREMSPVESGGGNDGKLRKTLGGYATPSKRAKLLDDDDDDKILTTIFAKNPPQESIPTTQSNKSVAGSSLPRPTKDKRISAVEAAFAALEEVKFGYKDADSELLAAQNLAENYQQGLSAEVKKNGVLQEALDKAERELEAKCRQGLEKSSTLEKAKGEVEASQREASNYEQGWNAEVKKNVALKEDLESAKRELEAASKEASKCRQELEKNSALEEALKKAKREVEASQAEASNYELGWNAEVKKNVALKEDLENAKRELGEARNEAAYYGDMYRQKLAANMELQKSLETAKKELDAEKKRSVIALEEADEAKKSAAAAQQEVTNLHSRIRGFYLQCCSKD